MKKISVLLVLCFLLSALGINTVSAQSPQTGYISLIPSGYDTSIPREKIASVQLQTLMPELLKLQHEGVISNLVPDLYGGYIEFSIPGEMNALSDTGLTVYSDMTDAVVPAPYNPDVTTQNIENPGDISGYASVPVANLTLYSNCQELYSLPPNSLIKGTLSMSSRVVATLQGNADASGYLWGCFNGTYNKVIPGDNVKFNIYNTSGTLVKTISGTIPRINFTSFNKSSAVISGTGPAGKTYTADWYQYNQDYDDTKTEVIKTGTIPSTGSWSIDFGNFSMWGGSTLNFTTPVNTNLKVTRSFSLPALVCEIGSNFCELYNLPNISATIIVKHGSSTYTFSGKTDNLGMLYAYLENSHQEPITLAANDTISGTGAATYKLHSLTAVPNTTTDQVRGVVPANANFLVFFIPGDESAWYSIWAHSNASGAYVADFSGIVDIPTTFFSIYVWCWDKVTGNGTEYRYYKGL